MAEPLLSIIIACYNCEDTVDVTLRSLAMQEIEGELEVIMIDDGSVDSTRAILESWGQRPGFKVILNQCNLGIGSTRNVALRAATGRYVGFVDADDWVSRHFFRNLVDELEKSGVAFVKCDHTEVNRTEREVSLAPEPRRGHDLDPITSIERGTEPSMVDYPYSWSGVYRRSFLVDRAIEFADGLHSAEDRLFTWRLHCEASRYRCVSEVGYFYRRESDATLTRVGDRRQLSFFAASQSVLEYVEQKDLSFDLRTKAHRQAIALICRHYSLRERLTPEAWCEFRDRAADALDALDFDLLSRAMQGFGQRRVQILQKLSRRALPSAQAVTRG